MRGCQHRFLWVEQANLHHFAPSYELFMIDHISIGVSPNIIDASFQALMDSVIYKLVKSGAPA